MKSVILIGIVLTTGVVCTCWFHLVVIHSEMNVPINC